MRPGMSDDLSGYLDAGKGLTPAYTPRRWSAKLLEGKRGVSYSARKATPIWRVRGALQKMSVVPSLPPNTPSPF